MQISVIDLLVPTEIQVEDINETTSKITNVTHIIATQMFSSLVYVEAILNIVFYDCRSILVGVGSQAHQEEYFYQ